jgi:23S rRNA pseudouridine2604 synthase
VDPRPGPAGQQQVTILLHKPMGYVSGQAEDGHEPAVTLVQAAQPLEGRRRNRFCAAQLRGLAPAGRLDIDSVGLLVLTQDGRVARQLIGEDSGHREGIPGARDLPHRRRATWRSPNVHKVFPPAQLARLRHGLSLDGQPLKRAQVDWQNPEQLRFVLTEGKKRQIRRMCEQGRPEGGGPQAHPHRPGGAGATAGGAVALPGSSTLRRA